MNWQKNKQANKQFRKSLQWPPYVKPTVNKCHLQKLQDMLKKKKPSNKTIGYRWKLSQWKETNLRFFFFNSAFSLDSIWAKMPTINCRCPPCRWSQAELTIGYCDRNPCNNRSYDLLRRIWQRVAMGNLIGSIFPHYILSQNPIFYVSRSSSIVLHLILIVLSPTCVLSQIAEGTLHNVWGYCSKRLWSLEQARENFEEFIKNKTVTCVGLCHEIFRILSFLSCIMTNTVIFKIKKGRWNKSEVSPTVTAQM